MDLTPDTYLITVNAFLPDNDGMLKVEAAKFSLIISCCAPPTIITAPKALQTEFEYRIGDPWLDISLDAASYVGDNSCCLISLTTPPFMPIPPTQTPPASLFAVQSDIATIRVEWTNLSEGGPLGYYLVSYQPSITDLCTPAQP